MSASTHLNTYVLFLCLWKTSQGSRAVLCSFPFKERLVAQLQGVWPANGLHLSAPSSSDAHMPPHILTGQPEPGFWEAGLIRPGHCSLRHVNSDESICSTASPQEGSRLSWGFVTWFSLCPTLLWPLSFSSVDSKQATCTHFHPSMFPSTQPVTPHLKK